MNLLSDELRRNPFAMYDEMRSSCPLFKEPGSGSWMIFDYDGVKRALHDHEAFSSEVTPMTGKAPDWLIFSDPPRHTQLRAIIMRAFTPRSIASLEPRIRALAGELLEPLVERGTMDLATDFAGPLPTLVIAEMIGIPAVDRPRFLGWSEIIMNLSYSVAGGPAAALAIQQYQAAKVEMKGYLAGLLEARRTRPEDDLLTRLVEAELDGARLSEDDILGFFQLLLAAGTETTTNVIDNALLCFIEHPGELARLRADAGLLPSAIEEVVRYRSPAQLMFRAARRDVELHGQRIPRGALVLAMIGSANRDPRHFADPHRFDVGRDPNPHLGFGHGIHFCIGAPLARLEARVALAELLARADGFALASDAPWPPRKALHVHGPASLPIRVEPLARRAG